MVQKSAVIFESTKNDRLYQFVVPVGAPFGEVFDFAFEMLGVAEQLQKDAFEKAKKAAEEEKAKNEKSEEVSAEVTLQ